MRKINLFFFYFVIVLSSIFTQESKYYFDLALLKNEPLWNINQTVFSQETVELKTNSQENIKGTYTGHFLYNDSYIGEYKDFNGIYFKAMYKGNEYYVAPKSLDVINSTDSLVNIIQDENAEIWIPEYFIDALYKKDRNIVLNKENSFVYMNDWYSRKNMHLNSTIIVTPSFISFNHILEYGYWIKDVTKESNKYKLTLYPDMSFFDGMNKENLPWDKSTYDKLPLYINFKEYKSVSAILVFDGDYLVLSFPDYLKRQVYCKVNRSFLGELLTLLNMQKYEFSFSSWPRHADGTCDYEPSNKQQVSQTEPAAQKTNVTLGKSMMASDNLRLREGEETSSAVITTMLKGTSVKVVRAC